MKEKKNTALKRTQETFTHLTTKTTVGRHTTSADLCRDLDPTINTTLLVHLVCWHVFLATLSIT